MFLIGRASPSGANWLVLSTKPELQKWELSVKPLGLSSLASKVISPLAGPGKAFARALDGACGPERPHLLLEQGPSRVAVATP